VVRLLWQVYNLSWRVAQPEFVCYSIWWSPLWQVYNLHPLSKPYPKPDGGVKRLLWQVYNMPTQRMLVLWLHELR